jgi:hypothetical protein
LFNLGRARITRYVMPPITVTVTTTAVMMAMVTSALAIADAAPASSRAGGSWLAGADQDRAGNR